MNSGRTSARGRRGHQSSKSMGHMPNVQERALEICKTHGSGSNEYAAFMKEISAKGLPAGVTLPRYVPGDIRESDTLSARSRKKKGGKKRRSTGIEKPIRSPSIKSTTSSDSRLSKASPQHARSVSETLWIEGLDPVVITTRCSADVGSCSGDSEWTSTGTPQGNSRTRRKGGQQRPLSRSSTGISPETELELKRLRSLADQYKSVLDEKARVEGNLDEARKRNESLRRQYQRLERHHSDLTSEQDMMNEQVSLQLQQLLKEKSQLMEENNKLKTENDNLQVLLEYAAGEPESDDDFPEPVSEKMAFNHEGEISLQGISAWHPGMLNQGGSGSEGASHFGDENDIQSPTTSDGVQVDILSGKLDKISLASCRG